MANTKRTKSARRQPSKKSGSPALRAQAEAREAAKKEQGLSFWVKLFLAISMASGLGLTLYLTWGFVGQPRPEDFILAGMVGFLTLSLSAYGVDKLLYRTRSGVSKTKRMQQAVVILLALVLALTVLGTALAPQQAQEDPVTPSVPASPEGPVNG